MRKIAIPFVVAAELLYFSAAQAEGLCSSKEEVIFSCEFAHSISSLCQSEDGLVTYRSGTSNKIRLEVSDEKKQRKLFYFSSRPLVGGGEAHVRFENGDYTYFMFDKTSTTTDGSNASAGVIVFIADKKVFNRTCNNDASIRKRAYQTFPREAYQEIESQ